MLQEAQVLKEAEPDFVLTAKESPYCDLSCDLSSGPEPLYERLGNSTRTNLKRKLRQWQRFGLNGSRNFPRRERFITTDPSASGAVGGSRDAGFFLVVPSAIFTGT